MRGSQVRTGVALVLAAAAGACGTIEGLDPFTLEDRGALDASVAPADGAPGHGADGPSQSSDDGPTSASDATGSDDGGVGGPDGPGSDAPPPSDAGAPTRDGEAGCTCVDPVPSGWQGLAQLVWSDAGAAACAAPYSAARGGFVAGVVDAAAQCSPCTCGQPPSGPIHCQVQLGSGGALCAGEAMTIAPQGACVVPPGPVGATSGPNGDSYGPTAFPAPAGTCAAGGGQAAHAAPVTTPATACAMVDAGTLAACGSSGQVCAAPPSVRASAVGTNLCIYRPGVQTCPHDYPQSHVVSAGVVDSRGCAGCSCAAPGCPSDGFVQGFTSPNCAGTPATTFDASTPCMLLDNANLSVSFVYTPSQSAWNGTCAPSGGTPTGTVTLDTGTATTFCCLP